MSTLFSQLVLGGASAGGLVGSIAYLLIICIALGALYLIFNRFAKNLNSDVVWVINLIIGVIVAIFALRFIAGLVW